MLKTLRRQLLFGLSRIGDLLHIHTQKQCLPVVDDPAHYNISCEDVATVHSPIYTSLLWDLSQSTPDMMNDSSSYYAQLHLVHLLRTGHSYAAKRRINMM